MCYTISIMEQYGIPKTIKQSAISGVEFGTIPEQFNKQDVWNGTVKALLDLKSLVEEEIAHNSSLSHEFKKRLERAHTDVHLFFSSIIGPD